MTAAHADVIAAADGLPRRLARGRAHLRPVGRAAAGRRPHEQPAARRHARAHRRARRARARRRRDRARARRAPGRHRRQPDRRRPRRLPRHPPPPAAAPVPRAHVRDQPAALLGRRADRPRARRARRRPAAERRAHARVGGARSRRRCARRTPSGRPRSSARCTAAGPCGGCWRLPPSGQVAHAASATWPPQSPWTTQISVLDADGNAASLTCSTGCGSGVVVPGTGVHLNNMLGETDLNVASLRLAPGHAADEHDGAVARARGRRRRARRGIVGVGADPLGDRPGRGRGARPRAAAAGGGRACRACIRRATCSTARAASRPATLDALEAAGEQVVRWPGRNIYFGGAQVVSRTRAGFAAAGDPRRGGAGIVVAPDARGRVGSGRRTV